MNFEFILVENQYAPQIALIRLNRPKELNALNLQLMLELKKALLQFGKTNIELRDKVFSSEIIDSKSLNHLASTREALSLPGLTIETK